MPIITVYGVPNSPEKMLNNICDSLINEAIHIDELELTANDISCFFPKDLMKKGLGEEIIIMVNGLFIKPKRTNVVRNKLARKLATITKTFYPHAKIECLITPFDANQGFYVVKK